MKLIFPLVKTRGNARWLAGICGQFYPQNAIRACAHMAGIPPSLLMYLHQLKRSWPLSNPAWVHSFCTEYIIVYACMCVSCMFISNKYNFHENEDFVSQDISITFQASYFPVKDIQFSKPLARVS